MTDIYAYSLIAQMTDYIRILDYGYRPSENRAIMSHICDIRLVNNMRDEVDQKIKSFDITSDDESYSEIIDYLIENYKL